MSDIKSDIKGGARVFVLSSPANAGTVARTGPDGFMVAFDSHGRKRGEPRRRFSYPWSLAARFTVGVPAPGSWD